MTNIRAIAFYLPQFYPTPENDEWWEPGFTEWTNVARAKPLFKGHYQPRLPRDLSFYDLRVPETREKQAQLAREAGIEGFCYWHYWFGNGKRLLSEVFKDVVEKGKPDFPFCLCWANHSWYQKTWDPNKPNRLLIEQTYPGVEDYKAHFMEMLPAFMDSRYMRTEDGRLIFGIFDADNIPDSRVFFNTWNDLAKEYDLIGFYFFGLAQGEPRYQKISQMGYDAVVYDCLHDHKNKLSTSLISRIGYKLYKKSLIHITQYSDYSKGAIETFKRIEDCIPCIDPDFDHSPRSGMSGIILHGSTPEKWGKLLSSICNILEKRRCKEKFLFIKSWNEWGEGNYLEPDSKWGKDYIIETGRVLLNH